MITERRQLDDHGTLCLFRLKTRRSLTDHANPRELLPAIARKIADRVEAESFKQNVPVAVTVIGIHGNVVFTHRMTGTPAFSLELPERKACTTARPHAHL